MKSEVLPRHARTRLLKCLPKVCEYWNVSPEEVLSRSRKRHITTINTKTHNTNNNQKMDDNNNENNTQQQYYCEEHE